MYHCRKVEKQLCLMTFGIKNRLQGNAALLKFIIDMMLNGCRCSVEREKGKWKS